MTDIVAFIRERLDEDEQIARAAADQDDEGPVWQVRTVRDKGMYVLGEHQSAPSGRLGFEEDAQTRHVERHDPARALAQVAAIRHVVERLDVLQKDLEASLD
ncbi:DUF6221 family protein [Nocardia sp. NPDC050697]|uniref:DUF6221 family protein n=1 Tax=Nocardia sp. NPDC050697 TaxID=3155158 RepID=UPI0033D76301